MTKSELALWSALRGKKVASLRFRRQHPIGPYFADFACLSAKVVVEVDGASHHDPKQVDHDLRRTRYLRAQGFEVLRFWNGDVLTRVDWVVAQITTAVADRMKAADDRDPLAK